MQRCIRCDGELEKGFILDRDGSSRTRQTRWTNGELDDSVAGGLWNRAAAQNIPTDTLPVVTYRCKNCGRLEAFAPAAA
jgi:hypothetical protein